MPVDLLISLVAVTLSVGLLSSTLASSVLRRYAPERQRLRRIVRPPDDTWRAPLGLTNEPNALAERICRVLPRSPRRMGEMRRRLVSAGYRSQAAPPIFAASQIVFAIMTGVLAGLATGAPSYGILGVVMGFGLPGVWLSHQIRKRTRAIQNGLPDVVDLLIVCLESGCSLDQAVLKTGEELALAYKPIADELALVANEIRAGKPRTEAFTNFSVRTASEDVGSLVGMLVQTDRYGTSIAQALRGHADVLRTRRRQRAEERAAKAGVKLVIPLVFCLFPAFYILAVGPILLQFARAFNAVVASVK
jgi:tight adherence protein C